MDPRARNQARLGDQVLASERPAKLARRAGPRIDSEDYYYNQHYDPRLHAGEEMVTQHGPRLQNHNLLNILFYIRLTDRADDVVVKVLKESVRYLLKEQEKVGREIIGSIYLEEWVHKLVKKDLHSILSGYPRLNNGKFIQIWPFITNVYELAPDMNSLLQPNIDIAYTLGGDGTLLSLVRDLYLNYKPNHLPYIAAFNSVSIQLLFPQIYFSNLSDLNIQSIINPLCLHRDPSDICATSSSRRSRACTTQPYSSPSAEATTRNSSDWGDRWETRMMCKLWIVEMIGSRRSRPTSSKCGVRRWMVISWKSRPLATRSRAASRSAGRGRRRSSKR